MSDTKKILLTHNQQKWLLGRGGRNVLDVLLDKNNRKFILMWNADGDEIIVYIPNI